MRYLNKYFLYCILLTLLKLFFSDVLLAQNQSNAKKRIVGKILTLDKSIETPLQYATVRLLSLKDSTMLAGTTTGDFGDFEINISVDNGFFISVSCVGYHNYTQYIPIENENSKLVLKDILLVESAFDLAEATVVAQRSEMQVKNDTIEYNSAAYKLKDNAVVEDLLKRLPGISITDDGKILVNGKEVKRVMVDGKDFFRSNPNLSIKNIPAEIMDKLQIIDDKSELSKLTGVDDGEENIAINITIQPGKKRGWLVSNNLGGGFEQNGSEGQLLRYSVNSFAARLVDETQLGIIANGNNINGINIGGGASSVGGGKPGLNSSLSGGVNFSSGKDNNNEKWVLNGDLSYGFTESLIRRNAIRQYYLQDSTSYQTDTVEQFTREQGLRFSAKIENRSIKGWTFSFSPSASYEEVTRIYEGSTVLQAGNEARDSVNSNNYLRTSVTPELSVRALFTVSHDFEKKGRKLSMSLDSRFSNNEAKGETEAEYHYYRNASANRVVNRDQQWKYSTNSFVNRAYFSYIEPIAPKHSLQFVYWIRSNDRENLKNSFKIDEITGEYSVLDLAYSKSIDNLTLTQQVGMSYRGVLKKVIYTVGLDYNPSYIKSRSFIQGAGTDGLDSTITYFPGMETFNYAPNAYLMYNIGKGKNLRFDYRGRSESPSVYQLDPSRDETNPTNIRIGNPSLQPQFTHWTRLRYNNNNRQKQQSLSVNLEANYILNDIVNYTNYDDLTGVKTTMPINQSGSWNANGMLLYNRPLGKLFQVNNYTQFATKNNIGFSTVNSKTTSQKTIATTVSVKEELSLTFKWEWLYMISRLNYQLGNTTYSVESMLPKKTSSAGGFVNVQLNLAKSWTVSTVLNYRMLTGFATEYDRTEMLWNVEIGKTVFKNKAASFSLLFNDILQQQLSVSQVVSSNYVEDQQYNTLKSFVMLVFSYRFNTMGSKKG